MTTTSPTAGPDLVPIRRALLSVSDKTGLIEFATALHNEFKVQLISTGGTATYLRDAGLSVTDVAEVTAFPEMMDGRVKTLHPKVHGGLLALRDHKDHQAAMWEHGIEAIDLLCVNLYPFAKTIERPDVSLEEAIENIDIGGPAMIRSAAKNHAWVVVVTAPGRYEKILGDLRKHEGKTCLKHRRRQAQNAFAHTAEYDALIAKYLAKQITPEVDPEHSDRQAMPAGGPARHVHEMENGAVATATGFASEPMPGDQSGAGGPSKLVERLINSAGNFSEFVTDILATQAVTAVGTEAAAFSIKTDQSGATALSLTTHIRPGDSSPVVRKNAIEAFQKLVLRCVEENKDGAIEVGEKNDAGETQYCLVTLLRENRTPAAVTAVIARCPDMNSARRRLNAMQLVAGYFAMYNRGGRPNEYASNVGWAPPTTGAPEVGGAHPTSIALTLSKKQELRYGENPHQKAALYVDKQPAEASVAYATQHHGKELSYINLLDADGALSCVKEFSGPAACIVKHTTPCGAATAADLPTAFKNAYAGDPLAAFGGIVALNKPVDLATAEAITSIDKLLEVIVAPSYAADALELLKSRWKNVRLLAVGPVNPLGIQSPEFMLHKITGGYLVQERDLLGLDETSWKIASARKPTDAEMADLRFGWLVCKHVKSNAIVVAKNQMLLGAGAGQMDRPSAAKLAIEKAGDRIAGSVAASDAFFPFPDGPRLLLDAGVTAIIHPGGSLKDQETIDLINQRGAALVLTGQRHFKH